MLVESIVYKQPKQTNKKPWKLGNAFHQKNTNLLFLSDSKVEMGRVM